MGLPYVRIYVLPREKQFLANAALFPPRHRQLLGGRFVQTLVVQEVFLGQDEFAKGARVSNVQVQHALVDPYEALAVFAEHLEEGFEVFHVGL